MIINWIDFDLNDGQCIGGVPRPITIQFVHVASVVRQVRSAGPGVTDHEAADRALTATIAG